MAAKKRTKQKPVVKAVKKIKETQPAREVDQAPTRWSNHPVLGMATPPPERRKMPWFGWLGLAIIVLSEILLYTGDHPIAVGFTPLMWTGYIMLLDGWIWQRGGISYFIDQKREWPMLFLISVLLWSMFEVMNFKVKNWHYINIPPLGIQEIMGCWAYGTIIPALFRTRDIFATFKFFVRSHKMNIRFTPFKLALSFVIGIASIGLPLLMSDKWANLLIPFVWLGFIFLIEPINYLLNIPRISIFRQLEMGNSSFLWQVLAAGLFCGLIWEFLNGEAVKAGGLVWIYDVAPFWRALFFNWKIGEMPIAGFGGYPPFIWENFVLYELIKYAMQGDKMWKTPDSIDTGTTTG